MLDSPSTVTSVGGIWADVRFDHAAAQAAIDAMRRAGQVLDDATSARIRFASDAKQEWRGHYRNVFDDELHRARSEATRLSADLRRAARDLEAAADSARLEQRRREEARARIREEQAKAAAASASGGRPGLRSPA
jgi:uncharacterized protein YukE